MQKLVRMVTAKKDVIPSLQVLIIKHANQDCLRGPDFTMVPFQLTNQHNG